MKERRIKYSLQENREHCISCQIVTKSGKGRGSYKKVLFLTLSGGKNELQNSTLRREVNTEQSQYMYVWSYWNKKLVFVMEKQHILSIQCTLRWNHSMALDKSHRIKSVVSVKNAEMSQVESCWNPFHMVFLNDLEMDLSSSLTVQRQHCHYLG